MKTSQPVALGPGTPRRRVPEYVPPELAPANDLPGGLRQYAIEFLKAWVMTRITKTQQLLGYMRIRDWPRARAGQHVTLARAASGGDPACAQCAAEPWLLPPA